MESDKSDNDALTRVYVSMHLVATHVTFTGVLYQAGVAHHTFSCSIITVKVVTMSERDSMMMGTRETTSVTFSSCLCPFCPVLLPLQLFVQPLL